MVDIDAKTGLPVLPDDCHWHIEEHVISIVRAVDNPWTKWRAYNYSPGRGAEQQSRWFWFSTQYRWRTTHKTEFVERYGEWDYGYASYPFLKKADPVTAENIAERTENVYNEWQAEIKRQSIYGDYPPKKFEGSK